MPHGEYGGPVLIKVSFVPARAAYLVRAGSRSGLRRAVQEATTRWGGMTEPIIPVHRNGTVDGWWRQVVEVAKVEGLVDVDVGSELAASVAESLDLPVTPINHIDRDGPTKWTTHPDSLPSLGDPTQAPVIASANGPLWQAVIAGDFTPEHEAEHRDIVRYRRPSTADQVARAALHGQTFLDRTVDSFYENSTRLGPWPMAAVVWVTAKDSIRDCLWFWNFRALQSRNEPSPMILLPVKDVHNWLNFPRDLAKQLERPDEFAPDVSMISLTVSQGEQHVFAVNFLGLQRTEEKPFTGHKWPAVLRTSPFTYRLDVELRNNLVFEREYGEEIELEAHPAGGKLLLRFASPVNFSGGGYILLRLKSALFDHLPRKDVLAEKIVGNSSWCRGSIQIATHTRNDYPLEVNLPTLEEAVHALIASKTTRYELSEKGRLADALIADTDLTVLLRPSVYEAIALLTTPRSSAFKREMAALRAKGMPEDEVQAFGARWGGRGERTYASVAGFKDRHGLTIADPVGAFETLCQLGWAERGVETVCSRCGLQGFVLVSTLQKGAQCPGCYAPASFTAGEAGLAVQYRLNTLIDRASDQGVIPHLLAIAALSRKRQRTSLLGGTLVTFSDGLTQEIDILGIHDRQFVAGEVKTKSCEFTQEQLERDISKSTRLGVDTHVLAAVDEVPSTVVDAAQKLADEANLKLLVLSTDQLRP